MRIHLSRPLLLDTAKTVSLHGNLWLTFLLGLLFLVPQFWLTFRSMKGKILPRMTTDLLNASDWAWTNWMFLPLFLLPFLVLDGLVYFLLHQGRRTAGLGRVWSGLMYTVVLCALAWLGLGLVWPCYCWYCKVSGAN